MICGQIDEQFVGRIVEHLATLADLEKWDGQKPLLELPLAIWCLAEVRSTTRLTSAGVQMLEVVIDCARRAAQSGGQPFLMEQLLPACKDLGERWPGRDMLVTFKGSTLDGVTHFGWGEDFWPHFIASVLGSRDAVKWLAYATEGAIEGAYYRSAALQALADKWPDDTTRKLLEERAVKDEGDGPRSAALQALADKWPDDTTRKLLEERAVKDEDDGSRRAALQALADKWPDDTTRKLLKERAGIDGIAASLLGGWHSEFGRIVFAKDLDGFAPFLDPAEPISPDHIKRAAEKAHVPADKIDETVRSLSAHLGWDITKGAAG